MDWLRLYAEFATDPKVQMMSEAMQRRLIMLFCLQCSNGIETFHETERETAIAFAMRISEDELAETKEVFLRKGFINEEWALLAWDKRQYVSDSSTTRVRKHREKVKAGNENDETLQKRFGNGLEQIQNRTDTEQNIEEKAATKAAPKYSALDDLIARGVDLQTASDWLAVRKAKKSPPTKTALDGVFRELTKAGIAIPSGIQLCCERGWAGFNPSWLDQPAGKAGSAPARAVVNDIDAINARNNAEAKRILGIVDEDEMRTINA